MPIKAKQPVQQIKLHIEIVNLKPVTPTTVLLHGSGDRHTGACRATRLICIHIMISGSRQNKFNLNVYNLTNGW